MTRNKDTLREPCSISWHGRIYGVTRSNPWN